MELELSLKDIFEYMETTPPYPGCFEYRTAKDIKDWNKRYELAGDFKTINKVLGIPSLCSDIIVDIQGT